jgi:hypothetical protein
MADLFAIETFLPAYMTWLTIRLVGFHEAIRLW